LCLKTPKSFAFLLQRFVFRLGARLRSRARGLRLRFRRSNVGFIFFHVVPLTQRDGSTGFLNFLARGRTDFVRLHLKAVFQFAVAKDFYAREITADEVRLTQELFIDNSAGPKCIEVAHVHNGVTIVKSGVVKSALWQSPNQRHLPPLEPQPDAAAGTRLLTLGPLPAGFPVSRTFTAA